MDDYTKQYTYIVGRIEPMSTYELEGLLREAGVSYKDLPPSNKGLIAHYVAAERVFGGGYNPERGLVYDVTNDVMIPSIIGEYVIKEGGYVKGSYAAEDDVVGLPWDVTEMASDVTRESSYDRDAAAYPTLTAGLEYLEPVRESSIDYMEVWDDYNKEREELKEQTVVKEMDEEMKVSADTISEDNKAKSAYTDCLTVGARDVLITYYNQLPWGYLHPDYNNAIDIDGVMYPSATNAIYASILFTSVDKRIVSNTGNALLASIKAEKLFTKYIDQVMTQSVFNYYYGALAAGAKVDFAALQIADESIPFASYIQRGGDMLEQEFDPQGLLGGEYPDVYSIKSDIDGYLFSNVFDYIDFKVRELFGVEGRTLGDVQNAYLETKVQKACKEIVDTRLVDDVHFARLMATLDSIDVETRGYLKNYTDVLYTDALRNVISSRQVINRGINPYDIVDASASDIALEPWYEDRAREVISMLSVFEGQLAYKLDSFHVQQIIGHVYACTATDENILFQFYPRSFFTLVQSSWKTVFNRRADHSIIYEIWKFVCSLVFYVEQFSIPGAEKTDFIQQCRSKVRQRYSPAEVSTSISNANQVLDSLFNKIPADLTLEKRLAILSGMFSPSAPTPSSLAKLKERLSGDGIGRHARSILYLFS